MAQPITLAAAEAFLRLARPGQSFVYHRGFLPRDRAYGPRSAIVNAVADFMLVQGCPPAFVYADGLMVDGVATGHLTKRKNGIFSYEYIFTKAS